MTTAFQVNAFQNNAFQIDSTTPTATVAGWIQTRREPFAERKRFNRKTYDELKEAQRAAEQAAREAPQKAKKAALERAARETEQVLAEMAEASEENLARINAERLTMALEGAARTQSAKQANLAFRAAQALIAEFRRMEQDDEDEAITLLMMH